MVMRGGVGPSRRCHCELSKNAVTCSTLPDRTSSSLMQIVPNCCARGMTIEQRWWSTPRAHSPSVLGSGVSLSARSRGGVAASSGPVGMAGVWSTLSMRESVLMRMGRDWSSSRWTLRVESWQEKIFSDPLQYLKISTKIKRHSNEKLVLKL